MKTITCKEMGGTCDAEIQGETAEEIMEKGKHHVHETQDEAHEELVKKMENISEEEYVAWQKNFEEKFEVTPES